MAALAIREHSRFAVRRAANVRHEKGASTDALLVELSLGGCRLGNVEEAELPPGAEVSVDVQGAQPLSGIVRRRINGSLSVKFSKPLHTFELTKLISLCRGEGAPLAAAMA